MRRWSKQLVWGLALVSLPMGAALAAGRVEVAGGSNLTIGATRGGTASYNTATLSFTGSVGVNTGSGVQPTLVPTVSYASVAGAAVTVWKVVAGLTFNYTFSEAIMDSVYTFVGSGYGSTISGGTTTTDFPYLVTLGKRFALTGEVTYKPEIRVDGSFQTLTDLPALSFIPFQFSFFF